MDGVVLWIRSNQDVIDVYKKTKTECNYLHRSDNEFLMFLLEAAANVISIVQQFSPQMTLQDDAGEPAPIVTTATEPTLDSIRTGDDDMDAEIYPEPEPDLSLQDISHHVNELESVLESLNTGCSPAHTPTGERDVPIKPAPNRSFLERYKANNIPSFTQYTSPIPMVKQRDKNQTSSIPNVTIRAESELNMYTNKDALYTGKDLGLELCKEVNKETNSAFSAKELQKSSTAESQREEKEREHAFSEVQRKEVPQELEERKEESQGDRENELKRKADDSESSAAKKSTIKTEPIEPEPAESRDQPTQSSSLPHTSQQKPIRHEEELPDTITQCELDLTTHLMSVIQNSLNRDAFLTSQPSMRVQQSNENYVCLHCKQNFANERNLRRHVLTHTSQENYNCPHCAFMTTRRPYLAKHISTVHSRDRTSSILHCDQCEYKTPTKSHLRNHMLAHSGNRQYQCPHCTYNSNFSNALTRHMTMHSRDPPVGDN